MKETFLAGDSSRETVSRQNSFDQSLSGGDSSTNIQGQNVTVNMPHEYSGRKEADNPIPNRHSVPALSGEARQLLIEASSDKAGTVQKREFLGPNSPQLHSNGRSFIEPNEPRTRALWLGALDELIDNDLIDEAGDSGSIYRLTSKGYSVSDHYRNS